MAALKSAVERRSAESAAALSAGSPTWWKPREAALHAIGCVADFDVEAASGFDLDLGRFLGEMMKEDVNGTCPFLVGRSLWVASRLAPTMSPQQAAPFVQAAVAGKSTRGCSLPLGRARETGLCVSLLAGCRNNRSPFSAGVLCTP